VATVPPAAGRGGAGRTTGITNARGFGGRPVIEVVVAVELNTMGSNSSLSIGPWSRSQVIGLTSHFVP